jgi:hypothetical protein
MRLTDLNPRWIGFKDATLHYGVSFDCPTDRNRRLVVHFQPPIDPEGWLQRGVAIPTDREQFVWNRQGDTFETLTLSPSVDASKYGLWHGHIRNGEIV